MKKDQFVIACLESPAAADTVLPYARYFAAQLKKGIIVLNVSKDGQNDWLKQYGLPYVGLKGDWKTAIDGLPTAFGPNIHRKATPRKMMERGFAAIVRNGEELDGWYQSVRGEGYDKAHDAALTFARENSGATREIVNTITE